MKNKPMSIVAAVALNGVIGNDNDIPWRIPSDFKKFKATTLGGTVLMGRKTFDSIGRPLPKRRNIVLTSDKDWSHEGVEVVHDWEEAYSALDQDRENFIIGGAGVYEFFLPYVQKMYITHVVAHPEGDTYFPMREPETFNKSAEGWEEEIVCEEKDQYPYIYRVYKMKEKTWSTKNGD